MGAATTTRQAPCTCRRANCQLAVHAEKATRWGLLTGIDRGIVSPLQAPHEPPTAVVAALASTVEALDRDKMLDVVGTVHGNRHIVLNYDDLEEDRAERKCYGDFTRDIDPVCGSNGKKYTNLSMFNYRKCMIKIQESTEIQLVDMDFCKDVDMEDMEHIDE